jgi:hypothetical protein
MQYKDPFVKQIVEHWKANFPKQAAALERENLLIPPAEQAADRASLAISQALRNGLSPNQAEEIGVEEWGSPPNA